MSDKKASGAPSSKPQAEEIPIMHMPEENPNAQLMKSSSDSYKKKRQANIQARRAMEGDNQAQKKAN